MPHIGYEQISVPGPAVIVASAVLTIPGNATSAWVQANGAGDINYTLDGSSNPGASRGLVLRNTADPLEILIQDLKNMRFCSSGPATNLNVSYVCGRDI